MNQLQSRLEQGDLITPLEFEAGRAEQFARRHVCAKCLSHLNIQPHPDPAKRRWMVVCPQHGPLSATAAATKAAAERAENNRLNGKIEMRPAPPPRSPEDILRELGF